MYAIRSYYAAPEGTQPAYIPGSIFRATLDKSHWLTMGYQEDELAVPLFSADLMLPSEKGDNPVAFVGQNLTLSGFAWPEHTEEHLVITSYSIHYTKLYETTLTEKLSGQAGICLIFRGLFFEHNVKMMQKEHLWMDTTGHLKNANYVQVQGESR